MKLNTKGFSGGVRSGVIEVMCIDSYEAPVNIECWEGECFGDGEHEYNTELCFTIKDAVKIHRALGRSIEEAKRREPTSYGNPNDKETQNDN